MAETPDGAAPSPAPRTFRRRAVELMTTAARMLVSVPKLLIIGFLTLYRLLVSPLYGQTCRFYPSCSQYALTAVQQHGALRGSWLAGRRLLRCNPWNPGGVDHVPPVVSKAGCEHGVNTGLVTEPAPRVEHRVAPTDPNCAPSAPRRAA
ncbi:putative membrane protein insertion efficiency factor [Kineosporia succinea]|uniref:Putative membrane protein insertion efficiency factor n=2 Tax=Kineosporia succinea TaxID=84632 RepID=A0ABT9P110_9ACTN|nr:membrane protein insertion efficiency factor YidD [Kineosporia succinea]MDP9826375.1 putative membrane protein insertion efficiency factor [Kineosporia succinea]